MATIDEWSKKSTSGEHMPKCEKLALSIFIEQLFKKASICIPIENVSQI